MKTVLAFGTFDRLHEGHRFFLSEAAVLGDKLIVSVARDAHVQELKEKTPTVGEEDRLKAVASLDEVESAQLSDGELGSFAILDAVNPEIIAIGHDQDGLESALTQWMETRKKTFPMKRIAKYEVPDVG